MRLRTARTIIPLITGILALHHENSRLMRGTGRRRFVPQDVVDTQNELEGPSAGAFAAGVLSSIEPYIMLSGPVTRWSVSLRTQIRRRTG